jgi:hypothetical protein
MALSHLIPPLEGGPNFGLSAIYIYIYISVIELTDSINGGMGWVRVGGGVARRGTGCPRTGNEIESRICVLWMSMGQCISIDCS